MSVIIGLTGQTGAGKTTVSGLFAEAGAFVINCDALTRNIVDEDELTDREIKRGFPDFFTEGRFDRVKAAAARFSDGELLRRYNAAIFPHITRLIDGVIREAEESGRGYIMLDAPTLFEAGMDKRCDKIISCTAPEELRIKRIMLRDGITEERARARISAQHTEDFFRSHSDFVIENGGDEGALRAEAKKVIGKLGMRNSEFGI